jgi:hypothetical protein
MLNKLSRLKGVGRTKLGGSAECAEGTTHQGQTRSVEGISCRGHRLRRLADSPPRSRVRRGLGRLTARPPHPRAWLGLARMAKGFLHLARGSAHARASAHPRAARR